METVIASPWWIALGKDSILTNGLGGFQWRGRFGDFLKNCGGSSSRRGGIARGAEAMRFSRSLIVSMELNRRMDVDV